MAEIKTLWFSCIEVWGVHNTSEFFVFSIMAGWIAKVLLMMLFAFIAV